MNPLTPIAPLRAVTDGRTAFDQELLAAAGLLRLLDRPSAPRRSLCLFHPNRTHSLKLNDALFEKPAPHCAALPHANEQRTLSHICIRKQVNLDKVRNHLRTRPENRMIADGCDGHEPGLNPGKSGCPTRFLLLLAGMAPPSSPIENNCTYAFSAYYCMQANQAVAGKTADYLDCGSWREPAAAVLRSARSRFRPVSATESANQLEQHDSAPRIAEAATSGDARIAVTRSPHFRRLRRAPHTGRIDPMPRLAPFSPLLPLGAWPRPARVPLFAVSPRGAIAIAAALIHALRGDRA